MASIITGIISAVCLSSLFAVLHIFHLVSHLIRLLISIVENLTDQLDQFLIICRVRKRDVKKDLASLNKLPSHLAIVWNPINHQLYQFFSLRSFKFINSKVERLKFQQQVELHAIIDSLSKILSWSIEAGIKEITFYEERGLLNSPEFELGAIVQYLTNNPIFTETNSNISSLSLQPQLVDDVIEISYSHRPLPSELKCLREQSATPSSIKIHFINRHSGHEHIAEVTKALVELVKLNRQNKINFDDLNVKSIGEKICSTSIGMPDLLLVLGGRSLRLRGFPPWQLALTEIYHGRSYGILPYRIRYREFLKALNLFGNCEQRCGA